MKGCFSFFLFFFFLVLKLLEFLFSLAFPDFQVYEVKQAWLGLVGWSWQGLLSIEDDANKSTFRLRGVLVKVDEAGLQGINSMIFTHIDLETQQRNISR
jgi:hypothetical protein